MDTIDGGEENKSYDCYDFFYNLLTGRKTYIAQDFRNVVWSNNNKWYLVVTNQPVYGIKKDDTLQFNKLFRYLYQSDRNNYNNLDTIEVIEEIVSYDLKLKDGTEKYYPNGLKECLNKDNNINDSAKEALCKNLNNIYNDYVVNHPEDQDVPMFHTAQDDIKKVFNCLINNINSQKVLFYKDQNCTSCDKYHRYCGYFRNRFVIEKSSRAFEYCIDDAIYIKTVQADQGIKNYQEEESEQYNNYTPSYTLKPGTKFFTYHWINPERIITAGIFLLVSSYYCADSIAKYMRQKSV